jgi:2'-5' RNA ligase
MPSDRATRARYGVVLLVPLPAATEIDGLRRACGGRVDRIAPHVTLVPPVNVPHRSLPAALAGLRAAAAGGHGPLTLTLGPPAAFHPVSETLYLAVAGPVGPLRDAVFHAPLSRPLDHPFVPHVTLADGIGADRAATALAALADYTATVAVDRLHLLRQDADRRWVAVADVPFGRPAVVGRGGIELELWCSEQADPEVAALLADESDRPALLEGAASRVVAAYRRGRLVGAGRGWERDGVVELEELVVVGDQRGHGIGRQLRLAFAVTP